jgi:hypothetical protein
MARRIRLAGHVELIEERMKECSFFGNASKKETTTKSYT